MYATFPLFTNGFEAQWRRVRDWCRCLPTIPGIVIFFSARTRVARHRLYTTAK
jgi:hypothetical protein